MAGTRDTLLQFAKYPEIAYQLYQMLAPDGTPEAKPETQVKVETHVNRYDFTSDTESPKPLELIRLRCRFSDSTDTSKYLTSKHILHILTNEEEKHSITGLASSIIIGVFLVALVNPQDIIYKSKKFVFIGYPHVFNEFWNCVSSLRTPVPPKPRLCLDNLLLNCNLDTGSAQWLNALMQKKPEFPLEAHTTLLKCIIFPIAFFTEDPFIYPLLEEQQHHFEVQALLNKSFISFIFTHNIRKISEEFIKHIAQPKEQEAVLTIKILDKIYRFSTPISLVKYILKNQNFHIEDEKAPILKSILSVLFAQKPATVELSMILENIKKQILDDKRLPTHHKKDLIKEIMIYRINQQTELKAVYQIVLDLNHKQYAEIRNRDDDFPISARGSAMKSANGEITMVSRRFNEIRKAAKEKMCEIALQSDTALDELIENENYLIFISTHQDGYWFGLDSILQYYKDTSSYTKIKNAVYELEKDHSDEITETKSAPDSTRAFISERILDGFNYRLDLVRETLSQFSFWNSNPPEDKMPSERIERKSTAQKR